MASNTAFSDTMDSKKLCDYLKTQGMDESDAKLIAGRVNLCMHARCEMTCVSCVYLQMGSTLERVSCCLIKIIYKVSLSPMLGHLSLQDFYRRAK